MSRPTTQALTPIKKAFTFGLFLRTDQYGITPKTNKNEGIKIIINEIKPTRILCVINPLMLLKNQKK